MKNAKKYYNHFGIKYKIYDANNYPAIFISGINKRVHLVEWEKYNGKKPKGMEIHFKDNDKQNWSIKNLLLVNRSDHCRIHFKWKKKNGEWFLKKCSICKKYLHFDKFYMRTKFDKRYKKRDPLPTQMCKKCMLLYQKKRSKTKEFREKRRIYEREYYQKNKIKKYG